MIATGNWHPNLYKLEFIFSNLKRSLLYPSRSWWKHISGVFVFRPNLLDSLDKTWKNMWFICGLYVVYMWFICGLYVVYMWFICGLYVVYMWFICGLYVFFYVVWTGPYCLYSRLRFSSTIIRIQCYPTTIHPGTYTIVLLILRSTNMFTMLYWYYEVPWRKQQYETLYKLNQHVTTYVNTTCSWFAVKELDSGRERTYMYQYMNMCKLGNDGWEGRLVWKCLK